MNRSPQRTIEFIIPTPGTVCPGVAVQMPFSNLISSGLTNSRVWNLKAMANLLA
jgi:hypothetical protein